MLCCGILGTGRDVRGTACSRSHVLVDALDKARRASWLPLHTPDRNGVVSEDTQALLQTGKREGRLWGQGRFLYPELEFQVRTEFVS